MIITIGKILLSLLILGNSNEELNIGKYLKDRITDCTKIEYSVVAPKNIKLEQYTFDETRELKITGSYAYLPIKKNYDNGNSKNSLVTLKLKIYKNVMVSNRSITKKEYLNPLQ